MAVAHINEDLESLTTLTVCFPRFNESSVIQCASFERLDVALQQVVSSRSIIDAEQIVDATLSTKRDLGPVNICLSQTLAHLGLWPSATIHILFEGDLDEEWTICVKSVKDPNDLLKLQFLRAMDSIELLKKRIAFKSESLSPYSSLKLIYGGKVLKDSDTLISCGISSGDTVLCLKIDHTPPLAPMSSVFNTYAPRSEEEETNRQEGEISNQPTVEPGEQANDHGPPICRICYGGAEPDAPLITPCRCSGTISCVHLTCLNSWRRLAPTQASYRRCDQCGYEYRFDRTRLAELLLSNTGAYFITVILCIAFLYIGAMIASHSPERIQQFINQYSWTPQLPPVIWLGNRRVPLYQWLPTVRDSINSHFQFLKGGLFFCAVIGVAQFLLDEALYWYIQRQVNGNWFNAHSGIVLLQLVLWRGFTSQQGMRVTAVTGLLACGRMISFGVHMKAQELAQWLGERMLSVE